MMMKALELTRITQVVVDNVELLHIEGLITKDERNNLIDLLITALVRAKEKLNNEKCNT